QFSIAFAGSSIIDSPALKTELVVLSFTAVLLKREYKVIGLPIRETLSPKFHHGAHSLAERYDSAIPVLGLRLANSQLASLEVDLIPAQQPDFAVSHAGASRDLYGHV